MAIFLLKKSYQANNQKEIGFKDLWGSYGVFTTVRLIGKPGKLILFKSHIKGFIKSLKKYKIYSKNIEKNIKHLINSSIKKDINYYNSSDSQKFEQLNNFPEYKFDIKDKNESMNSEMIYSSNDYGEFNKIIETNNKEEKTTKDKNKKVKVIDYGKLKEDEKKIKNKLGIEKIKIVYFD